MGLDLDSLDTTVELARHNAAEPGYIPLFTALAGVAVSVGHPAHERMVARYRGVRAAGRSRMGGDDGDGAVLAALQDGLQLAFLFDPAVDVVAEIEHFIAWWRSLESRALARPAVDPGHPIRFPPTSDTSSTLLRSAAEAFAARGFYATSVASIARSAGVSKSTLLHHYGSKNDLLIAVLTELDELLAGGVEPASLTPAVRIRRFSESVVPAEWRESEGSVLVEPAEAYVVLLSEATAPEHPGHGWFVDRIAEIRASLGRDIEALRQDDGGRQSDAPNEDPAQIGAARSALWLIAIRDGLRVQWLYDCSLSAREALDSIRIALVGAE
ncbi:TetR/AcrR family transcriptional regulator [Herbiconiux liukaitaii]|uniref:TetR/AcrR family transcriptional regulator n=1 Tax=Herbiconiux liukaitaii TaxID=3342799 RepID=UPI0035B7AC41